MDQVTRRRLIEAHTVLAAHQKAISDLRRDLSDLRFLDSTLLKAIQILHAGTEIAFAMGTRE